MIETPGGSLRERLYEAYVSQHAQCSDGVAVALIYRRDIRPLLLAPTAGPVLDIGCGQGTAGQSLCWTMDTTRWELMSARNKWR